MTEFDGMVCSACGQEERASEGYPCADCGNFLCIICQFRGILRCNDCETKAQAEADAAKAKSEDVKEATDSPDGDPASSGAAGDAAKSRVEDPIAD